MDVTINDGHPVLSGEGDNPCVVGGNLGSRLPSILNRIAA